MSNQECRIRPEIININSNKPSFYPYGIKVNKCSGSSNNINNPYSKMCVPDVVKNINIKVLNQTSRTNEIRHIKWHETCKCKRRLDASVCNNNQLWNNDKCRCECKDLIDKCICETEFIWNPSNFDCECNKLCDAGECLDYKNCKSRKTPIDKLVEECSESVDKNELISVTLNDYRNVCGSCTIHIVFS